jgi:hypothetical protein
MAEMGLAASSLTRSSTYPQPAPEPSSARPDLAGGVFAVDDRNRAELGPESLDLNSSWWRTCDTFSEGDALLTAVCEMGLEGVVANNRSSLYRPNDRGWVKVKNANYWRRDAEREAVARKRLRIGVSFV